MSATPTKPTKAIVAGVGATLTALTTFWATVSIAFDNNSVDVGEYGIILTALLTLAGTVRTVWTVTNAPKSLPSRDLKRVDDGTYDVG